MSTETVAYEPFGEGALDFDVYQQLLAHDGLYKTESGFFVAARQDDVRDLIRKPKEFSSRPNQSEALGMATDGDPTATDEARARFIAMTEGLPVSADDLMSARMIVAADPPLHTHLRRVVNRAFVPRQLDKWKDWIQNRVDELMADVSASQPFDVVDQLCVPLPVSVIGEVLSLDPSEYGQVKHWSDEIMKATQQADRGSEEASKRLFAAFGEFVARFSPEIEDRRANPRDDIISVLVQKTDDGDISTADALYFLLILMGAGQETTTNLISNMIVSLYENPDQLELLLEKPELLKSGIEETLRYRGPVQVTFREAIEDTVLGGTEIPAHSLVVGLVGAANLDPDVYEDPLRFDITRDPSHVSFGHGIHFCVGAALARLEAETAMRSMLPLLGEMHMSEPPTPIQSLILLGFEHVKLAPNKDAGAKAAVVLDPDAQAVVDGTEQILGAPLNEMPIDLARQRMDELHALVPPGPEMHAVHDVAAAGPDGDVPLRVYVPTAASGLPVLLWIHGGAFAFGRLDYFDSSCSELAARAEAIVVSVEYRLAPEHPFPAGVEDSYAALLWVAEKISELGGDPARIAIGGDSAGGGLAAAVTLMARDRSGPSVVYQLLVYPALDDEVSNDEFSDVQVINRAVCEHSWKLYAPSAEDRENPYCAPIKAEDLSGLPPAFVVAAEVDPMRDSQIRYAERLAAAGVPTRCEVYPGTAHGFFLATAAIKRAEIAMGEAMADLRAGFDRASA